MTEIPIEFEVRSSQDRTYLVRLLNIAEREYQKKEMHEQVLEVGYIRKKVANSNPPYIVYFNCREAVLFNRILLLATNVAALNKYIDIGDSSNYAILGMHFMERLSKAIAKTKESN